MEPEDETIDYEALLEQEEVTEEGEVVEDGEEIDYESMLEEECPCGTDDSGNCLECEE